MSDEPVPETLETIAAKITALSKSMEDRFGTMDDRLGSIDKRLGTIDEHSASVDVRLVKVDERLTTFDTQLAETRAQLGVKIEAVDARVSLVYDVLIAMREESKQNVTEHETFTKRLNKHDLRILALEKPGTPNP